MVDLTNPQRVLVATLTAALGVSPAMFNQQEAGLAQANVSAAATSDFDFSVCASGTYIADSQRLLASGQGCTAQAFETHHKAVVCATMAHELTRKTMHRDDAYPLCSEHLALYASMCQNAGLAAAIDLSKFTCPSNFPVNKGSSFPSDGCRDDQLEKVAEDMEKVCAGYLDFSDDDSDETGGAPDIGKLCKFPKKCADFFGKHMHCAVERGVIGNDVSMFCGENSLMDFIDLLCPKNSGLHYLMKKITPFCVDPIEKHDIKMVTFDPEYRFNSATALTAAVPAAAAAVAMVAAYLL